MPLDLTSRFNNRQAAFNDEAARSTATAREILYDNTRAATELTPDELMPFQNHGEGQPVKIKYDKIVAIKESAADIGFITPIIVRKTTDGKYEILSGHHRAEAARELEQETGRSYPLPAVIYESDEIDDDTAYQIVAELNTPDIEPLPSERCKIFNKYDELNKYKDKEDTIKVDDLCKKFGIPSRQTFYRYKNIVKLSPTLIKAVDEKLLPLKDHERLPPRFSKPEMEEIGRYIYEYGKEQSNGDIKPIRITGGDINKLCDWREGTDELITADKVYEILTAQPDDELDDEDENTSNGDIYSQIRQAFAGSSVAMMSDSELDDLILRQLTAYIETTE